MQSVALVPVKHASSKLPTLTEDEQEVFDEMDKVLARDNWGEWSRVQPFEITPYLFLGNCGSARKVEILKELGINYVINMAAKEVTTGAAFYPEGFKYFEFAAADDYDYDIFQHYEAIERVIDEARLTGGKCLVHCVAGINRSGTLVTAYCLRREEMPLITAVKHVMDCRRILMTNESFRERLIKFATSLGLKLR